MSDIIAGVHDPAKAQARPWAITSVAHDGATAVAAEAMVAPISPTARRRGWLQREAVHHATTMPMLQPTPMPSARVPWPLWDTPNPAPMSSATYSGLWRTRNSAPKTAKPANRVRRSETWADTAPGAASCPRVAAR